jgi:hypothetical protein
MEDRLHQIRAKQGPNDRQYLIWMVHADTQNRTEIVVDRAYTLTSTFNPWAGGEVRTIRTEKHSGYECNSPAPHQLGEQDNSFSRTPYTIVRFFTLFSQSKCFMTKYHQIYNFTSKCDIYSFLRQSRFEELTRSLYSQFVHLSNFVVKYMLVDDI